MFSLFRNKSYHRLWKILNSENLFTKDQFEEAITQTQREKRPLYEVMFEYEEIPVEKILKAFSQFYQLPTILLRKKTIAAYVLNLIPPEVAKQHSVIIFKKIGNLISVATTNPENTQTIDFIKKKTGFETKLFLTTPFDIDQALKNYKAKISDEFDDIITASIKETAFLKDSAEKLAQHVPIIKMVNSIIEQALIQNASDIHFEPDAHNITIRYRIDGLLQKILTLPIELLPAVVARIKILSNLKIDEHRIPQDGRFDFVYKDREVAIRVSVMPILYQTKIVLRLLDVKEKEITLSKLGLNLRDLKTIRKEIIKPYGMILVTGPTGSGKTTTLYAILQLLNKESVNICTIEDPIEYGVEGINQTQTNPSAGLTFANGLRSLVRQDPDIIMVGEVRDIDTANIAVHTAMTGHLVLSSLHTNNAFLSVQRLIEMGIESFLAVSVVNVIIGQRLARKICPSCKRTVGAKQKLLEKYNDIFNLETAIKKLIKLKLLPREIKSLTDQKFFHGRGCPKCNNTGYKGRTGIFELVTIDQNLYKVITKDPTADTIKKEVLRQGGLTMLEDGLLKVFSGITTLDELYRVTKE